MMLIQAWTEGSPTGFEEVSLASGPHGLGGYQARTLDRALVMDRAMVWLQPSGDLITPGLGVDFFRIYIDT